MAARWWPTALERQIAVRYLRGQRGTRSASLQTIIATAGIAIGVAALIVVLGVMTGLRNDLRDRILVAAPHLRVLTYGTSLRVDDWRAQLPKIRAVPGVELVAPEVNTQTITTNAEGYPEPAAVLGIEPGLGQGGVVRLDSVMTQGNLDFKPTATDVDAAVVLGGRLAERLSVLPGDLLQIIQPKAVRRSRTLGTMTGANVVPWTVEVTGTFETGMYTYDNTFMVMSRADAQRFAGLDTAITDIAVRVSDPWRAVAIARQLDTLLGLPYRTEAWQEQNSTLFAALELEKKAMAMVIFFIMLVAAFNIVGTLTMVVAFKTREIGILRAMGVTPSGIGRIFRTQGTTIGLVGTTIGLVLGLALSIAVDRGKLIHLDPTVYFIDALPIRTEPLDVLGVVLTSLAIAVLATIPAARRASQLEPVEAIRAE
ncbi:MAG: ABC transporter permease [Gemmatimonadales bacterium]